MYRMLSLSLVVLMLLVVSVACGGDDNESGGDNAASISTSVPGATSTTEQATPAAEEEEEQDNEDEEATEETDTGESDSEGDVHVQLSVGSSGEVMSHDSDPMVELNNDALSPIRVTIVSIIDPATSESEIFQPEAGNRYWAVEVLLESIGDMTVNTGEPWIVTDADGNAYENMYLTEAAADVGQDIIYGPIEAGQSKQGVVVFEIPEDATVQSLSANLSIFVGGTLVFDAP